MTLTADTAGRARSPGLSYQELLDTDSRPVPDVLRWQSSDSFGQDDKPVDRYIARAIHELEKERLWTKVWQMACRESEIAEVGDTQVYDITDISILVVRTQPDARSRRSTTPASTAAASCGSCRGRSPSCAARSTATPGTSTGH